MKTFDSLFDSSMKGERNVLKCVNGRASILKNVEFSCVFECFALKKHEINLVLYPCMNIVAIIA